MRWLVWGLLLGAGWSQQPDAIDANEPTNLRSNFASLDCAAGVMEASPGWKGAGAVLLEDRDSYMISECSLNDKSIVIKLCQDILVDEVSLANYEYFSSMFKDLRILATDEYPVTSRGWVELGTFTAADRRDEQTFRVADSKLWASYVKIQFLSHWGDEFYCPINTIKVYGTTMMDRYKQQPSDPAISQPGPLSSLEEEVVEEFGETDCDDPVPSSDGESWQSRNVCPVCEPPKINVLAQAEPTDPADPAVCKVKRNPSSPFGFKQCCVNPSPPQTSVVQQQVAPVRESVYEALSKRLSVLELAAAALKTVYDESIGAQARAMESFLHQLNDTLFAEMAAVRHENVDIRISLASLRDDLATQRRTLIFQTAIVAILVVIVMSGLLSRLPVEQAAPIPRREQQSMFSAASDDEYLDELTLGNVNFDSDAGSRWPSRRPSLAPSRTQSRVPSRTPSPFSEPRHQRQ